METRDHLMHLVGDMLEAMLDPVELVGDRENVCTCTHLDAHAFRATSGPGFRPRQEAASGAHLVATAIPLNAMKTSGAGAERARTC
jgi:hypothetical protein